MNERTLAWVLHWGRRFQTRLVERAYNNVGKEYQNDQQKRREISPGELRRSGTCNPIKMDILSTRHLEHRRIVRGSIEDDSRKCFALSFLLKDENSFPVVRALSIRIGNPESSDISSGEVLKLHTRERRTVTGRDERGGILQCKPPTDSK